MGKDGDFPVSEEDVDELIELEVLDPTELGVREMYHRGLIDKERRESLLFPFKYKRQKKKEECTKKQVRRWQGMRPNQIGMELARNPEPDKWGQCMILKRLGVMEGFCGNG